jgi:hypothetical protein
LLISMIMNFLPCRKYAISGIVAVLVLSLPAIAQSHPIFPAKRQIGVSQAMALNPAFILTVINYDISKL